MSQNRSHKSDMYWLTFDEFTAGVLGGFTQVLLGQPFDTVKVRLQANAEYTSIMDCVERMYSNQGVSSFFKGTLSPLLGTGLLVSVEMGCNQLFKRLMRKEEGQPLTYKQIFLSGVLAGFVGTSISAPVEHGKIRMQMQIYGSEYKGSMDALKKIYHTYGLTGVYRGFTVTLFRELLPTGLYYLSYQWAKRKLKTPGQVNLSEIIPCGALAGLSYWSVSYPLDLIKTRVQHDSLQQPQYKGLKGIARGWREIKQQGWRRHLPGFNICMLRAMPVYGLNFYVYEKVIQQLVRAEHLGVTYQ